MCPIWAQISRRHSRRKKNAPAHKYRSGRLIHLNSHLCFQCVLKHLGEIDVPFQRGSVQPCRQGYGSVDRLIILRHPDSGHIHIHQHHPLVGFQCHSAQRRRLRDTLAVFLQTEHYAPKQLPCRKQRVIVVLAAGRYVQIREHNGNFLLFLIREYSRVKISFHFFGHIHSPHSGWS
nr:MAG TPA: hypothetical protein [Caudoviricetes sp.]